jgi:hypothetical protein
MKGSEPSTIDGPEKRATKFGLVVINENTARRGWKWALAIAIRLAKRREVVANI